MSKPKKTELPKCFTKDCLIDDACCAINGRDINKLYYRRKVIDEYEAWIKGKIQIKDDTIDDIVLVLSHYVRDMRGMFVKLIYVFYILSWKEDGYF